MLREAREAILLSIDQLHLFISMADGGRSGLAAIVGRRSGDGLALRLLIQHLLADLGVLPALQTLHGILPAAETQFHGVGVVSA